MPAGRAAAVARLAAEAYGFTIPVAKGAAEEHLAAGQHVQGGEIFRHRQRIMQRQQDDTGIQAHIGCFRHDPAKIGHLHEFTVGMGGKMRAGGDGIIAQFIEHAGLLHKLPETDPHIVVQAEHGPGGLAWLITWDEEVSDAIEAEVDRIVAAAPRRDDITATLDDAGWSVLVDGPDLDQWRAALAPGAACVFFETPANPTLELIDIAAVSELSHAAGAKVIVDNVFSTPLLQRPLDLGADIVVYSGTKHIDGQGRCLGGVVVSSEDFRSGVLEPFMRHTGPCLSPFNAWVLLKGLETLDVRVERQCRTTARLADVLRDHSAVRRVMYPGHREHPQYALGQRQMSGSSTLVSFDLAGGKRAAFGFMNRLELVDISNNLGDSKSLITHPGTTTHRTLSPEDRDRVGVTDGLVRLSVGLEDADDLADDLPQALDGI